MFSPPCMARMRKKRDWHSELSGSTGGQSLRIRNEARDMSLIFPPSPLLLAEAPDPREPRGQALVSSSPVFPTMHWARSCRCLERLRRGQVLLSLASRSFSPPPRVSLTFNAQIRSISQNRGALEISVAKRNLKMEYSSHFTEGLTVKLPENASPCWLLTAPHSRWVGVRGSVAFFVVYTTQLRTIYLSYIFSGWLLHIFQLQHQTIRYASQGVAIRIPWAKHLYFLAEELSGEGGQHLPKAPPAFQQWQRGVEDQPSFSSSKSRWRLSIGLTSGGVE